MKRTAARDVQSLGAAADTDDRQAALLRLAGQLHLEGIELRLGRAKLGMRFAAVGGRVEVWPTREQHAAEPIEQRRDPVERKRREHDGQSARPLDRAQIRQPKRHLHAGRLAVVTATDLTGEAQLRSRHADEHGMRMQRGAGDLGIRAHASTQVSLAPPR